MTEEQKIRELAILAAWIAAAERRGLWATAASWREMYETVAARPANEMVLAKSRADKPER